MTRKDDLDRLSELTGLKFGTAQAEMAALLKRESDLRRNLEELIESRRVQASASRDPAAAAMVAGADIRWHQWVDQRRAVINAELARVLGLKDACRLKLQRAFGRDQAAQALTRKAEHEARIARQRRANYES